MLIRISSADKLTFDCNGCERKIQCIRKDGIVKLKQVELKTVKEVWEHVKESTEQGESFLSELGYFIHVGICPLEHIENTHSEAARMVYFCEASHTLPYPGGYLQQPTWYIELYEHIMNIKHQIQKSMSDGQNK